MNMEQWTAVDRYITDLLVPADPALEFALQTSAAAGLPGINVTPNQGKLLHLLARIQGARKILEVGTLGGYSTIWLARAVPAGGRVITLEIDPRFADVARGNFANAGLSEIIEVRVRPAIESLQQLVNEGRGPFDLIFIDADKPSTADYYAWALKLSRPGTIVVVDNVVRNGAVADPDSIDPNVLGIRRFNKLLAADPRISATAIQTVGSKGYDGFALGVVLAV